MKLVTCDIETTGLNPNKDQTLEIGIVLYNSDIHGTDFESIDWEKLPRLCLRLIHQFEFLVLDDFIKKLNAKYLELLESHKDDPSKLKSLDCDEFEYVYKEEVLIRIMKFLHDNGFITEEELVSRKIKTHQNFAGKNFSGFDRKFLDKIFDTTKLKIRHRVLDPAILYLNGIDEDCLPDLKECKIRSGLFEDNTVSHTAVNDSIDTLKLILHKLLK